MKNMKLRVMMILGGLVLVCFAVGRFFDARCEKSCLVQSFEESMKKGGNAMNFHISSGKDREPDHDSDYSGPPIASVTPELPSFDGVDEVKIQCVDTDWVLKQDKDADKVVLHFEDVDRPDANQVKRNGTSISINIEPDGAKRASLVLPKGFTGRVTLATVSGEIKVPGPITFKALKVQSASGDIDIAGWPTDELGVDVVSGDVKSHVTSAIPSSKKVTLQSVSGDFDWEMHAAFEELKINTVSGSAKLKLPKSLGFEYKLHAISGDFHGFPEGGVKSDGFADKSLRGSFGSGPKAVIDFETVSGDIELNQSESFGSR